VLVTGPTSLHLPVATAAAEAGCHLFVEKPLADTTEGLERLEQALARHRRSLMVGYMLRFHPLLRQVKDWLADGTLGRPLHWRSTWGEYLPDWHPWEDYREGYAARRELGGGPALTFSHDIDLALWLFGPVEQGSSMTMPASPLRMDVPAGVDLLLRHRAACSPTCTSTSTSGRRSARMRSSPRKAGRYSTTMRAASPAMPTRGRRRDTAGTRRRHAGRGRACRRAGTATTCSWPSCVTSSSASSAAWRPSRAGGGHGGDAAGPGAGRRRMLAGRRTRNRCMSNREFDLRGKVILVTGAAGLIGREVCDACAAYGADVVLTDRGTEALEAQAARLRQAGGGRALAVAADVTAKARWRRCSRPSSASSGGSTCS
jgi:hypothetical protein